jgi:predicted PurR-regulated permease PerM
MEQSARWLLGTIIVAVSAWILQGFLHALLAATVIAVASWPLFRRFTVSLPRKARRAAPLMFTIAITALVFAPLTFAFVALASEAHGLMVAIADADRNGFALRHWLQEMPAGRWIDDVWGADLARPGALLGWVQRADPKALLGWAQSLGQFMAHHAFIILFTLLVLFFLYERGAGLSREVRALLRRRIGARADAYMKVAARAVRASVNGIVLVGLFDGVFAGVAYAIAGVPDAALWAAITGALALIPFLGYAAVGALALQLAIAGGGASAMLAVTLGCLVLIVGDKIVRPAVARDGTRLPFVWVLMGCLGGFETLGLVGLVIGPVALTLAREVWEQRVHDFTRNPHPPF